MMQARLLELGNRVRSARLSRNETQTAVAAAVGIHRTHLSKIEAGGKNITLKTLWELADHFGVPASHLLPHEGDLFTARRIAV